MPMMVDNVLDIKGFVSWYYLQHVRGYKPLLTIIENEYDINIPLSK